jgi:hypothetical protein
MQYTNQQLNQIYSCIGYNFYVTFEPQITSTIINTQQESDGGIQPDDTLQLQVLDLVAQVNGLLTQISQLQYIDFVTESSKGSKIDPARGDFLLRRQGRAVVQQICIILAIKKVRQDIFGLAKRGAVEDGGMSYLPEDWE